MCPFFAGHPFSRWPNHSITARNGPRTHVKPLKPTRGRRPGRRLWTPDNSPRHAHAAGTTIKFYPAACRPGLRQNAPVIPSGEQSGEFLAQGRLAQRPGTIK